MEAGGLWQRLPWVWRKRWKTNIRDWSIVLQWEFRHLPSEFRAHMAQPLEIVMGRHVRSDDSLTLEMAADELCALLAEHPQAEEAFRGWFQTRYPFYAD